MKRISHHQLHLSRVRHRALLFMAIGAVVVAGCFGVQYWRAQYWQDTGWLDRQVQDVGSGAWSKEREGKDEALLPDDALAQYAVAANLPRALYIERLSVAARVLPMSVNADGSMQAPYHIDDTGWYTDSARPGEGGAVFIDGHASGATREGVFAYLDTLKSGDRVRLEKGDGTTLTYEVVHSEALPLEGLDMQKALSPYSGVDKGLNLMTCTGRWLADRQTYDHRVVVYTKQL